MKHALIHTCANGLNLLVREHRRTDVVSVQVWVETGSALEAEYAGSGISHLLEHMVFKGTDEYTAAELNEGVSALGGLWNAYTSTDRTVYHVDGPAEHWQSFLHMLLQLTLHPTFPADEWEREREVIRREMDMYHDDPDEASYRALVETLFTCHPRRLPILGDLAAFDALTPEDMKRYHAERYVPGNMFICVVGAVSPEEVVAAVEQEVGSRPVQRLALPPVPEEPRQWGPRLLRREFAQPTSTLMLAWRIPALNHPDNAALTLLCTILGEGRSAWLYTRFHDENPMAHDITCAMLPQSPGEGALLVEADVERDRRDALRDEVLAYISTLPSADFESARRRALRCMQMRRLRSLSTVQGLANALCKAWHYSRNLMADVEWQAALAAVSVDDLRRVAAEWLTPTRLTEVSVDPVGSNPEQAAPDAAAHKIPLHEETLENGLRCVVREDRQLPLVYATLAVPAGCRVENAGNAGVSALLAECLPKGTRTRTAAQIAAEVEDVGGALQCKAGNNTLLLSLRCLAEDAPAMLELLADVALHPVFPDDAVCTAREDMLSDVSEAEERPLSVAFRRLRNLCFGSVSYGNSPSGTKESISSLSRQDVLNLHARLMCGANAVLSLAGDIDAAEAMPLVQKYFAAMPAGSPVLLTHTPPQKPADAVFPIPEGKEQAVLALALPALPIDHPDTPLLLLLNEWCQDMAGPIYSEIREKRGLAYRASSTLLSGVDAGCLIFYLETSVEQMPEARAALEDVLARLLAEGMSADDLERARATAIAIRKVGAQFLEGICSMSAVDAVVGVGADGEERILEALPHMTHDQMQAFIRRILSPSAPHTWLRLQ